MTKVTLPCPSIDQVTASTPDPAIQQRIERLKKRNNTCYMRALGGLSHFGRQILQLLPSLLHYNQPNLPGFVSQQVPHGICNYQVDEQELQLLETFCLVHSPTEPIVNQDSILGVYCMGSTASMGQSKFSDLDIWLCHPRHWTPEQCQLLEQKCQLLTRWAERHDVELNFFLIPDDKFQTNNHTDLGGESCGSAQHLLLLDEFYRSYTYLAGKQILWPLVAAADEDNYELAVEKLWADPAISPEQWFDLGGLTRIPAEEYFGSALWQLYKSLDSPYKAVIKTLLMEAYSHEYPDTRLLSLQAKRWMQNNDEYGPQLDSYYMMLDKVTNYLKSIGDTERLDLVRRCFYLKVRAGFRETADPLFAENRRLTEKWLASLTDYWGWPEHKIKHLNHRRYWKVEDVQSAYQELLSALMQSYRKLINFARRNNISESINPEDIGVLSRKLYAAFESLPGKVQRINLKIAPDLHEGDLSFIQVSQPRNYPKGWYLYKYPLNSRELLGRSYLEHNSYISKLVAWAYFNGLLTQRTEVHLHPKNTDLGFDTLNQFCSDLANSFPVRFSKATNQALSRPCEIQHLGIFLNLECDPTARWSAKELKRNTQGDVFCFGKDSQCIIGSIDLIYRNSWNEIRTLHFQGPERVMNFMTTLLGKMHQDARAPQSIEVFCYSQHYKEQIETRIRELVDEFIQLRLAPEQTCVVKTQQIGQEKYGVFFERRGVSVKRLENAIDFYCKISDKKLEHAPIPWMRSSAPGSPRSSMPMPARAWFNTSSKIVTTALICTFSMNTTRWRSTTGSRATRMSLFNGLTSTTPVPQSAPKKIPTMSILTCPSSTK